MNLTSVTGFSLLDYVLDVARFYRAINGEAANKQDLEKAVLKTSEERRRRWLVEVGVRTRTPKEKGIIQDCLEVMLGKWSLLEPKDDMITPTTNLMQIGELLQASREADAKQHLLDAMLRSRKEIPFSPSNILLKIRNRTSPQIFRMAFCCSYSQDKKRRSKVLPEPGPECLYTNRDGTALDDFVFVKDILDTNFRAFDIMCDWGLFFELLDYISLESEDLKDILFKKVGQGYMEQVALKAPEYLPEGARVLGVTVNRPTRLVYLTMQMASVSEILSGVQEIEGPHLSTFSKSCVRNLCAILQPIDEDTSKEEMLSIARARGILILSDGPDIFGIPSDSEFSKLHPDRTYLLAMREPGIEEFANSVRETHRNLTGGRPIVPVWAGDLSEAVCYELRIPESVFTNNLLKLKGLGKVQFHKSPLIWQVAGSKGRRRRPIIFGGRGYGKVSLV